MANWTYSDLKFYEWMLSETKKVTNGKQEVIEDRIIEIKRKLRKEAKRASDHVTVHDDGDYCIVKLPLPADLKTEEDAKEYFKEYEYIHYRPTYYDCTGQWFTSWYKIFQKPDGRFWAYHAIGIDV